MRSLPNSDTQMRSNSLSGLGWFHLTVISSSMDGVTRDRFAFWRLNRIPLCICTIFFPYPLIDWWTLRWFYAFFTTKPTARISCDILIWFPLDTGTVAGLLNYVVAVFLNFSGRDFTLFSVKAVPVYLPPVVCHGLFLLPLLHHFSLSDQRQTII